MDVQIIVTVMIKLFIILFLGFVLARAGYIDKHTNAKLSALISKITSPILIISSVLSSSADNRLDVIKLLGCGFLMYIGFMVLAKVICVVMAFPKRDRTLYECMLVFSNNAFMGYPIVQSLLGDEAIFYCAMLHFSFNIFIFSYGIQHIYRYASGEEAAKFDFKRLINPGFVLVIIALFLYISGIRNHGLIYDTMYMVGNVTSPLSMIVLGASLAMYPIKESLTDWRSYVFAIARLFIMPVITFAVCRLIGVNDYYTTILTITNGMPVASLVLMLGNEAGIDTRLIVRNIFVTTVLATFTVPLVIAILL